LPTAVTPNGGGQIREHVDVLQLTGARHSEQPGDGDFSVGAPIPKHDFAPLDGRAQRSLGGRMPRAGLCRVAVNRTPLLGADLSFAFGDVSA
jgi:hypothetical protein